MAWALHWAGIHNLIHYLDDFLFMGTPDSEEGAHILALALRIFQILGFPVAPHKTEGHPIGHRCHGAAFACGED